MEKGKGEELLLKQFFKSILSFQFSMQNLVMSLQIAFWTAVEIASTINMHLNKTNLQN